MERAGGLAGEGSGTRPEGWSPGHSGRFSPSCGASPGPGSPTEAADEPVQKQSAQVPSSRATRTVSSGDQAGCAARLSRRKAWGCREGSPGRALSGDRSHSSAAQEPITDHVQASGPCEKSGRNLSNPSGTLKSLVFCFFLIRYLRSTPGQLFKSECQWFTKCLIGSSISVNGLSVSLRLQCGRKVGRSLTHPESRCTSGFRGQPLAGPEAVTHSPHLWPSLLLPTLL